jgi:hypothetical protein
MAFVPEDGTGLPTANSYATVAAYAAYWIERGVDLSQYPTEPKQESLVLGTDHIELFFGCRLYGFKATSEQALQFPRIYLYDSLGAAITGVPTKVKNALFEYAYRVLKTGTELVPDPVIDPSGMQVQATFEKVGPIEERITYTGSERVLLPPYPKADAWLKEFMSGGQGSSYRA